MQIRNTERPVEMACFGAASVTPRWYALHARSNFEARVTAELAGKGFTTYLPAFEEVRRWKDRKKVISVPVFPGYVFAQFSDRSSERLDVLKTRGLVRILGFGSGIEPVPDEEIERLRLMLNSKLPCFSHPFIRQGDWVRVKRGALSGLEGILVRVRNQDRLVISIGLLSQAVATEIDARDIEPLYNRMSRG